MDAEVETWDTAVHIPAAPGLKVSCSFGLYRQWLYGTSSDNGAKGFLQIPTLPLHPKAEQTSIPGLTSAISHLCWAGSGDPMASCTKAE